MNTQKQYRRQLVNLLCGISAPKLMGAALEAILTSKELEDIEHRLQIFQMLTENTPQRQIAAKLKVGIATVTRGARAYRNGKFFELERNALQHIRSNPDINKSNMDSQHIPKIQLPGKSNYIKLSEDDCFFELFRKIEKKYQHCFLFESLGEESGVSRNHIIGFDPAQIVYAEDKHTLCITDTRTEKTEQYQCENSYYALREIVPQDIISRRYAGGLVGYLGYDTINFFEPTLNLQTSESFEPFKFGVYLDGLVYDQMTGEIFYYYYNKNRIEEIKALLHQEEEDFGETECTCLGDSMSREEHEQAVLKVKEYIRSGLIFQCEVGFKTRYKIIGDTTHIYSKLREVNPSPHMFYLKFDQQKIIGASPELLFRLRDGEMETFPLAGTARRGADAIEDMQLARELLNDPKEIAEHNMLVDLHRNDLGRVARYGTVKVRSLMDIKRFSHVQHISSEIVGILNEKEDMFSALASNFPAGTLSGAPKIEAIKIINELESDPRGPYGGAVGQFGFNGDCTFAIPIRSVFINGEDGYVQTCGGNVYDSNPADEYQEIERKLSAMRSVLASFEKEQ
ncbi:chorismate-binding protein [Methylobacter tundripaludum]|uniref:chorismate-binding protein n=1 Tax=Methylobacter tundripaludum TaxID=173365 RepID=UPI0009DF8711|nr:chorismate-binding protein [Methylobacter tundripaludum]